ncbi:MAG: tetratricopeptide repeat protein [Nostoc sp. NMS1]|nr:MULTISPECIES: tetratricopeptide repeat protein [unclassified Nostoc]MBN3907681.1 tetratricopeptide repeat protein [Nostoc sp. NMS1]
MTEAIALYEQIIAQYPQYAPAWYQLGVIIDNQGQTNGGNY